MILIAKRLKNSDQAQECTVEPKKFIKMSNKAKIRLKKTIK
jgi:hypothetical protein